MSQVYLEGRLASAGIQLYDPKTETPSGVLVGVTRVAKLPGCVQLAVTGRVPLIVSRQALEDALRATGA